MVAEMFARAQAQFGNAVKGYWFHDGAGCPACGRNIDALRYKGGDALSLNAFIYRKRGVLIGYLLCGRCARQVFRRARRRPGQETEQHAAIEETLIRAYEAHMNFMDA